MKIVITNLKVYNNNAQTCSLNKPSPIQFSIGIKNRDNKFFERFSKSDIELVITV